MVATDGSRYTSHACAAVLGLLAMATNAVGMQPPDNSEVITIHQLEVAKEIADRLAPPGTVENIYWYQRAARSGLGNSNTDSGPLVVSGSLFQMFSRQEVLHAYRISPFVWRPRGEVQPGEFRETVALIAGGYCTGTVIGSRAVLTAAHCVCELGSTIAVVVEQIPQALSGTVIRTRLPDCAAYKRADKPQRRALLQTHGDMAVLRLDRDVSVYGVAAARFGGSIIAGQFYTIVGYGKTDSSPDTPGKKMYGRIVAISCTAEDATRKGCRPGTEFLGVGEIPASDGITTDACSGDSGGPVFVAGDSQPPTLVGVISRPVGARCGEGSIYGALDDATIAWIGEAESRQ